jgi:hypothetical protein
MLRDGQIKIFKSDLALKWKCLDQDFFFLGSWKNTFFISMKSSDQKIWFFSVTSHSVAELGDSCSMSWNGRMHWNAHLGGKISYLVQFRKISYLSTNVCSIKWTWLFYRFSIIVNLYTHIVIVPIFQMLKNDRYHCI